MKKVFRRPSPAMVVSIIALVFAVVGTGVASVATVSVLNKQEKKQTKKISKNQANNEITKRAPGLSVASAVNANNAANSDALGGLSLRGLSMWVLLQQTATGGVVSSSGGVSTTVLGTGRARVHFPNPVTNCAINANGGTSANASDATNFAEAFVMVGRSTTGPNDVQYEVTDDAGTPVGSEPVFMTIQC
jgi:hypothetical protein